ncbi:MAG TPA: hypothetical protein PLS84_11160 [Salinivirgaceae bacterium]|nr:hypothetical protein [Salinivirgaceae bacterium]
MRKITLTLLIGLLYLSLYSQDTVTKPLFLVRPYFENGVDFIRSDELKQKYETKSKYFWGFGVQIGNPKTYKIRPYGQVLFSKIEVQDTVAFPDIVVTDNELKTTQFVCGLIVPLKHVNDIYYRARFGGSYSIIKESFYNIDTYSYGIIIGLGVEKNIFRNLRIYFDISYNFQKIPRSELKDFDMLKLSMGFVI